MTYEEGVETKVRTMAVVPIRSSVCIKNGTECVFFRVKSCPSCKQFMFVQPHNFITYLTKQLTKEAA